MPSQEWVVLSSVLLFVTIATLILLWCPRSFTAGELLIVSQSIVIGILDAVRAFEKDVDLSAVGKVIRAGLLGTAVLIFYLFLVQKFWRSICKTSWTKKKAIFLFFSTAGIGIIFFLLPILFVALRNEYLGDTTPLIKPLHWLFVYILDGGKYMKILLLLYWTAVLWLCLGSSFSFTNCNQTRGTPQIIVRKYFHFLCVLLFVPAILYQRDLASLGMAVALALFLLVEATRLLHVPVVSDAIHRYMVPFVDCRDTAGDLFISHIYLLLGCAVPLWIVGNDQHFHTLAPFSGVITLGIGDAVAAVIGKTRGERKWPGTEKTMEGTIAAFLAMSLFSIWISALVGSTLQKKRGVEEEISGIFFSHVLIALLETFTDQMDNAVLPLFAFAAITLSNC
eukprot:g742.t1